MLLINLSCNDTSAFNAHPGNSVATPEGRQVANLREEGRSIGENFAAATAAGVAPTCETYFDNCRKLARSQGHAPPNSLTTWDRKDFQGGLHLDVTLEPRGRWDVEQVSQDGF